MSSIDSFNNSSSNKTFRTALSFLSIVSLIVSIYLVYKGYQADIFSSDEALANFLDRIGAGAPLILIFLQVFRTVIKIIPTAIILLVGALIFGQLKGLIYNTIGSIIGSVILFYLARNFGDKLVKAIIGRERYNKFIPDLDSEGKFKTIFTIVLFLPFGPYDTFCMLAGLSNMNFKEFLMRICISKPVSIFICTNILLYAFGFVEGLFS